MADDATPAKPDVNEIATSADGRDITRPYMGPLLMPSDSVLASLGQRWEAYREIRRDGQVHATMQQRRLAIVSRPLVIEPGANDAASKAAADQLRLNLEEIAFDRATKGMSWGFFYGFSVGECMWTVRDNKVWLGRVKVRTPWRFRFTPEGELRLLTMRDMFRGEPMPDRKFWVMSSGADNDDEPYGLGLAYQLWWYVYFKKQGLAFWLRALEKFGGPTAVGKYPPGTPVEEQAKLLAAAVAIRTDGAVIIPEGMALELLEASRGTVDQSTFLRQMNAEISKIVVGQTMTTDDGSSLAQGKVHFDVREELTDADVEELNESFQQGPARWLTEWNFPGAAIPKITRPSPEDEERTSKLAKEAAETVNTMSQAGLEPDDQLLKTKYPGWRRKAVAAPAPIAPPAAGDVAPAPAFAEPAAAGQDAIDAFLDQLDWEEVISPIRDDISAIVTSSGSLEAAAERLVTLLTAPSSTKAAEKIARALLQAGLAGQAGLELDGSTQP